MAVHGAAGYVFDSHETVMGRNSKWGLYTEKSSDAFAMATALTTVAEPFLHPAHGNGFYEHYHTGGHTLFGYYRVFHVWYGAPISMLPK